MIRWGVACGVHDGSLCVMDDSKILFASHAERYSGVKNDPHLNQPMINDALEFGHPEEVHFYENPLLKTARRLYAGQGFKFTNPASELKKLGVKAKVYWGSHHKSHTAAGFYTSPFNEASCLTIDAIGEFDTTTIWHGNKSEDMLYKVYADTYPASLGLFYSAMTDRIGLKANEDEYILMGMSAYGDSNKYLHQIYHMFNESGANFHQGCRGFLPDLIEEDYFDIAAATQAIYELEFKKLLAKVKSSAKTKAQSENLVLMGGCALNCLANRYATEQFENVWIMPNPGDAGSSLGAILAHTKQQADWQGPYLGREIEGRYPVNELLKELTASGIVGVANGKAEFGPRALGNRSLLADPRGDQMKDVVNRIKRRQEFRPFAPVILQEDVSDYFDVETDFESTYMQYVVRCTQPEDFPAIVHVDGTSRVQTVTKESHAGLYALLTQWKAATGCPMLLNTSLNIKGMPMVNDLADSIAFEYEYGVKVF